MIRPAASVPAVSAGIPPAAASIDLRLDGNQGRAPSAAFAARLGDDADLLRRYPLSDELERALAVHHGVSRERIFVGAGADDVLDRLCRALLEPGREAIVPLPTFEMLPRYVALARGTLRSPAWTAGNWPRAEVLAALSPATALVAIVSPNNPTGLCATGDDLRAVLANSGEALVLVDAAYAEFGGENLTALAQTHERAVVVRTFSKAYGLAGLRVGYAIAPPDVVRWLRAVGSPFTAGAVARRSALLRLPDADGEVAAYVAAVQRERQQLAGQLTQLGAAPLPSMGNFVYVRGVDPGWLRDGLAGLGIAVRAFADGVRITVPGDAAAFARLQRGVAAVLAPQALLLDLDGVLADLDGRKPLCELEELQALAARWPIGVVTSCPRRLAESVLQRYGLLPFVKALVVAEDGPGKPDPAPVRLALQRLGVEAAWMLGDNPGDVQAARGAGVVPLAIAPSGIGAEAHAERLRAAGAARLLPGLAALLPLLA